MKSKEELKKELHRMIDSIEDAETLNVLHDDMVPYVANAKQDIIDELSAEEQKELQLGLAESAAGENYSKEEFLKILAKWRIK